MLSVVVISHTVAFLNSKKNAIYIRTDDSHESKTIEIIQKVTED